MNTLRGKTAHYIDSTGTHQWAEVEHFHSDDCVDLYINPAPDPAYRASSVFYDENRKKIHSWHWPEFD